MTMPDTPGRIQWKHSTINRDPVVQTMTTEFAGIRYRVTVETTGRRTASRHRLDQDEKSTPIGDWYVTTDAAVDACIADMGFERREVAVSFTSTATDRPQANATDE